jgi:uncharacterized membrane protein YjjP (DUF1212 family)
MKRNLDQLINKYISRKLVVFAVGSFGLFSGNLTSADWVIVSTAYIGSQMVVDVVDRLIKSRYGNNSN